MVYYCGGIQQLNLKNVLKKTVLTLIYLLYCIKVQGSFIAFDVFKSLAALVFFLTSITPKII